MSTLLSTIAYTTYRNMSHMTFKIDEQRRLWLTVHIGSPNSTLMPMIGAQTLTIVRVPHIHDVVLANCEQQIALAIILDLSQRTLVALQQDRPLQNSSAGVRGESGWS